MKPLLSGYVAGSRTGGPNCERLERQLEESYHVKHALVVNSATAALHCALEALNVEGGEVIVPAYTMSASAAAVLQARATVRFADIGDNYCLDWAHVRTLLKANTRAIVLVHLFGYHASVPGDIAVPIVHDCSQAPSVVPKRRLAGHEAAGSSVGGRETVQRDVWVHSYNQHKILSAGEGGCCLTFDSDIADRISSVRNHGEVNSNLLGWNYRMLETTAQTISDQLPGLWTRNSKRHQWAIEWCINANVQPPAYDQHDLFMIAKLVNPLYRKEFAEKYGAHVGYNQPVYSMPYFRTHGYNDLALPNVERIEAQMVTVHPEDYDV